MRTVRTSFAARAAMAMAGSSALILGVLAAGASPASAATLACGTTITASVTLSGNINCTSDTTSDALTIGAANITVNLNGHKVLGPGAESDTEGIVDNPNGSGTAYNGVTIENGTISNFGTDIDIEGMANSGTPPPACSADLTGAVVKGITTTNNALQESDGVYGSCLSGASIHSVSISDAVEGVELEDSQASTVSSNHLQSPLYAMYDENGTGDTWSDNVLSDVNYSGIELFETTADVVKSNTIAGTGASGVDEFMSSGDSIVKNVLSGLYSGLDSEDSSDGTVSSNKGSNDAWGVYTEDTEDYSFTGNHFTNSEYGIETDYPGGEELRNNVADHNSEVGILVYTDDTSSGYSATLDNNTGNDNRYGLFSDIPTGGSGNRATGNTVVNCYNVSCATGGARAGAHVPSPPHRTPVTPPAPAARRGVS